MGASGLMGGAGGRAEAARRYGTSEEYAEAKRQADVKAAADERAQERADQIREERAAQGDRRDFGAGLHKDPRTAQARHFTAGSAITPEEYRAQHGRRSRDRGTALERLGEGAEGAGAERTHPEAIRRWGK